MDEIIEQAIEKVKEEMNSKPNGYKKIIGNHVIGNLAVNKASAKEIVNGNKTLAGSLEAMRKEAEKFKEGNVAVLTDEEGFKVVDKYYGFIGIQTEINISDKKEEVKKNKLDLSLESLGL